MNHTQTDALTDGIWAATDVEAVAAVAEALSTGVPTPVAVALQDAETALLYAAEPRVRAVAWGPVLAHEVVEEFGPHPLHRIGPEPVLVGDNHFAGTLAAALIEAWSDPGQQLTLHCVGQNPQWAQEAEALTSPRGDISWSEVPLLPLSVTQRIQALKALWEAPPARKGTPTGPTVIVSISDSARCVIIAAAVAASVDGARVAAVVEDATIWPTIPGVTLFSTLEARKAALTRDSTPTDRLVTRLFKDTAWMSAPDAEVTKPEEPLFAPVKYADEGAFLPLDQQSEELRTQLEALAGRVEEVLAAGDVLCGAPADGLDAVIMNTPSELTAMAEKIMEILGVPETRGTRLTALELAFRLPSLASRAGFHPRRAASYQPLLSIDLVESLAPMVHFAYQDVSAETNNATGSSLALQMWGEIIDFAKASNRAALVGSAVTHAAVGLAWRRATSSDMASVKDELVGQLAELEHRRWALNQRRNGAQDHAWMLSWNCEDGDDCVCDDRRERKCVDEGTKLYDVRIMQAMPSILAYADIEVYEA